MDSTNTFKMCFFSKMYESVTFLFKQHSEIQIKHICKKKP